MSASRQSTEHELGIRQQGQDVVGKRLAWILAAATLIGMGAVAVSAALLSFDRSKTAGAAVVAPPKESSKLEYSSIRNDARGQRLRRHDQKERDAYGWVDREARVVSIPVDQAMKWLVSDPRTLESTPQEER